MNFRSRGDDSVFLSFVDAICQYIAYDNDSRHSLTRLYADAD